MTDPKPVELNESNFRREVHASSLPVLVDFWATWCPPCRVLSPTVDALASQYAGRAVIGKVDVDQNQALAQAYDITSIPTVLLFVNGKVVNRFVGVQTKEELGAALDQVLDVAIA